jgi:rod shape-determining protein MreD
MKNNLKTNNNYILIAKIIFFTVIISIIPLPKILLDISPIWVLLSMIYCFINTKIRFRLFFALFVGILFDILQADILGQTSLALILSTIFIINIKKQFEFSNTSTQQVYVFVATTIYLFCFLLVYILTNGFGFSYYLLITPISSALFWPVIRWLFSKLKH